MFICILYDEEISGVFLCIVFPVDVIYVGNIKNDSNNNIYHNFKTYSLHNGFCHQNTQHFLSQVNSIQGLSQIINCLLLDQNNQRGNNSPKTQSNGGQYSLNFQYTLVTLTYSRNSQCSRHCAAVLPTMGAIVLHCVGISLAKCNNFSSSSRLHSVFLILGSNHSNLPQNIRKRCQFKSLGLSLSEEREMIACHMQRQFCLQFK